MFTFFCTTCEAKLIVKDEKLIGKIVPCPQCGSMVLVQTSDDTPTPFYDPSSKVIRHKRFPDVLTSETASGVIGHTSKANLRAEFFLETAQPNSGLSEVEVKTRKILIGVLIGLTIFLLTALGYLMVFQGSDRLPPEPPPMGQPIIQVPVEPPVESDPVEPDPLENPIGDPIKDVDILLPETPSEVLPEIPPTVPLQDAANEPVPIQDRQVQTADDTLSALERRMPGFVDLSVPAIDIDAKLALLISEWNFDRSTLIEFVRVISRLTEIPMTLDIDEMKPRSLSAQTPVSGQFSEATAGEILTTTLATLGLQWTIADRQILISPTAIAEEADLTFDVSDLAERTDDLTPEVLAELVRRLVVPETNVVVLPDRRLTIVADKNKDKNNQKSPMRQRDEVLRFLEQLRAIRQLPQKTELTSETLAPEAFGWDRVMMPMTLNHYRAVPLSRIILQLEATTDLTIIVDHQSLHRTLTPFASVLAAVQCDRGTVNDVLELSLASVGFAGLAYRIIDDQTLEITTTESSRKPEKMTMEVHRYELQADETPEDIVRSLRSAVFPDSWEVPEHSEAQYGGDIVIDRPSHCLLVRQSQPAQRQIRLFHPTPELLEEAESLRP